jgi:hypothetical protein
MAYLTTKPNSINQIFKSRTKSRTKQFDVRSRFSLRALTFSSLSVLGIVSFCINLNAFSCSAQKKFSDDCKIHVALVSTIKFYLINGKWTKI